MAPPEAGFPRRTKRSNAAGTASGRTPTSRSQVVAATAKVTDAAASAAWDGQRIRAVPDAIGGGGGDAEKHGRRGQLVHARRPRPRNPVGLGAAQPVERRSISVHPTSASCVGTQ